MLHRSHDPTDSSGIRDRVGDKRHHKCYTWCIISGAFSNRPNFILLPLKSALRRSTAGSYFLISDLKLGCGTPLQKVWISY